MRWMDEYSRCMDGWMERWMMDGQMHRWLDDTLDQCGFVFLVGLIAQPVSVAELGPGLSSLMC